MARSGYRALVTHDDWWDAVYEEFERVSEIPGIRLKTPSVRPKSCVIAGVRGPARRGKLQQGSGSTMRVELPGTGSFTLTGLGETTRPRLLLGGLSIPRSDRRTSDYTTVV